MRQSSRSVPFGMLLLSLVVNAHGLTALAQNSAPLAFEVASVKRALEPTLPRGIDVLPGRFTSTDMPLMSLIIRAYGAARWKIQDAPDWVGTERFNVQATFPSSSTPAQVNAMLRTLLEQRFRLSVHREARDMDTDALILANRDRRLGPGMHPVDIDCDKNEFREGSGPGLFSPPNKRPKCGTSVVTSRFSLNNPASVRQTGAIKYVAFTLSDLADSLSNSRERPLLDRTELPGRFDIALEYASQTAPSAAPDPGTNVSTPSSAPTLLVALEEQLGLKLRRERNPVEVLIVRSVERLRPEEN